MFSREISRWQFYAITLLFSVIIVAIGQHNYPVISNDATLYLRTAQIFLQQGFNAAKGAYNWPFYSILLAEISRLTGLSLITVGNFLNYIFFIIAVFSYLWCLKNLGASRIIQWLGLAVILCYHTFTKLPHNLIRDNGYFAFYLMSIACLIRFYYRPTVLWALAWSLSLWVALLFRVEAICFIFLVPFVVGIWGKYPMTARMVYYIKLNAVLLLVVLWGVLLAFFHIISLTHLGKFHWALDQIHGGFGQIFLTFTQAAERLALNVTDLQFVKSGAIVLFWGLVGAYLQMFVTNFQWSNLVPFVYAWRKESSLYAMQGIIIVLWYVFINLAFTFSAIFQFLFLTPRYLMACHLTLLILVPFGLLTLYHLWNVQRNGKKQWSYFVFYFVILLFLINLVGTLIPIGPSKRFVLQAAQWVNQTTGKQAMIYTNDNILSAYLARKNTGSLCNLMNEPNLPPSQCFTWVAVPQAPWNGADYLILRVNPKKDEWKINAVESLLQSQPIKQFQSHRRDDQLLIFKLKSS